MSKARVFGMLRPRLNIAPLLLTPGFALVGYAVGGPPGSRWALAAWLAIMLGATCSCALHAWRNANATVPRAGRRNFDFDVHKAGR